MQKSEAPRAMAWKATGACNQKRQKKSESDNVDEKLPSQVVKSSSEIVLSEAVAALPNDIVARS
jgi:hypothetical protein